MDGVTGSGKTLVYFNRLREIINRGYQALIMLPEIGLTAQFKKRFVDFFGFEPAIWHSATSKKNKTELTLRGYCWFKWEDDKVIEVYNAFDPTAYSAEMSN